MTNKIIIFFLALGLGIFASEARAQTPKPGSGGGTGSGSISANSCSTDKVATGIATDGTLTCVNLTSAYLDSSVLKAANNLSDLGSISAALNNLGIPNHNLCSVDSSGNFGCPGTISGGVGSGFFGVVDFPQGTDPGSYPANTFSLIGNPTISPSYRWQIPSAEPGAGLVYEDGSSTPSHISTKSIPTCANDGGHALVYPSTAFICENVTGGGGSGGAGSTYFTSVLAAGAGPSDSGTETSIIPSPTTGTQTLPVSTFTNGAILNLDVDGIYSTPSVTSDTATFKLYAGATVLATSAAIPLTTVGVSMTNQHWGARFQIGASTTGTTGLLVNGEVCFTTSTFTPFCTGMTNTANVAVTLTATQVLDLKVTLSGTTSGEDILGTDIKAYIPGAPVSSVQTQTGAVTLFNNNAQTSTYTATTTDFLHCKTIPISSGTFTITLVANTSQPPDGQCIRILNYGTGVITYTPNGQNLNGSGSSLTLAAGSASAPTGVIITSDGTNYNAQPLGASSGGGSGAMTLISDQVLGSSTAVVTFSSIPGTYKSIELHFNARCDGSVTQDHFYFQVNTDTSADYYTNYFVFTNGTTFTGTFTGATPDAGGVNCASSLAGGSQIGTLLIPDYAGTVFLKTGQISSLGGAESSVGANYLIRESWGWLWNSTSAITTLKIGSVSGYNFVTGSHFSLYGIN